MLNTYLSYQLIAQNIPQAIDRIEMQPAVERETQYYLDNIGKVKSIDEFVDNDRLFKYAMKAFGLGDMDYAKAFMKKALKEGVSDPDSFANKLTDKRYAEFVKAFDFADNGDSATAYNPAQQGVTHNYSLQVEVGAVQTGLDYDRGETFNFLAKIGNVKSVDDLMADKRLLSYAMAAYGLDADKEAPETVRQMLEGGVSDPQSPANKLYDKSYAKFVKAFDFAQYGDQTTARAAVLSQTPQAYLAASGLNPLRATSTADQAEIDYFNANIGKVTSITDLMGDKRLLTFAMAAFGLDANTESPATVRAMLTGGVSDPASPANQLSDKRYAAFVRAFDFAQYGSATTARDEVTQATPALYLQSSDPENAYFRANIGKVKSVDGLMADKRLLSYAMSAYSLDASTESSSRIRTMLLGGVTDPYSPANLSSDKRYAAFVGAFDFNAYGAATTSRAEVLDQTPRYHVENANPETAYFRANIAKVRSAGGLMADDRLLAYAMAAYGLDASTEDPTKVKAMLEGGVSSTQSPANRSGDPRYVAFVAAFDFQQYGAQTTSRSQVLDATPSNYTTMDDLGLVKPSAANVKAETDYYLANVAKLTSVDDLMANKRVLDYALSAFGLDPKTEDPAKIRSLLEGGVRDPDSPVNKLGDKRYIAFVAAFNFEQYGDTATTYVASGQPTVDKYMRQTLEEDAGQSNEGVRLALYFQRNAPKLTDWYQVLADKALSQTARVAFGMPDSFASADIDQQVKFFQSKMDITDFADADKLNKFITRFTSMYELQNPTATATTSVSVLFAQPTTIGVSTDLLMAMQQLKF